MGFLDKLKGAANLVTGGAAKVAIEWKPTLAFGGEALAIVIDATSTGAKVDSGGVFVDVVATERAHVTGDTGSAGAQGTSAGKVTFEKTYSIAGAFALAPGESKRFEGSIELPRNVQPTYEGVNARHEWQIRGRIETVGNDPDSGFLPMRVGLKA